MPESQPPEQPSDPGIVKQDVHEDIKSAERDKSADQPTTAPGIPTIQEKKLSLGWVGRIFGDKHEKTGNIAITAIIFAFLLIVVVICVDSTTTSIAQNGNINQTVEKLPYAQVIVTGAISIITAALGYVFGVKKSND